MCTEGMEAAETEEWLGELGSDLQGPMESCCFFRRATTFCATEKKSARKGVLMQGLAVLSPPVPGTEMVGQPGTPDPEREGKSPQSWGT